MLGAGIFCLVLWKITKNKSSNTALDSTRMGTMVLSQAYDTASAYGRSIVELFLHACRNVAAKTMGAKSQIKHLNAHNEVAHAYSAHEKVWKHFGTLIKNVSLEEGVARMAAWAKKAGARRGKPFEGIRSPQKSSAVMGSFGKISSIRADKQCRSSRAAFVKNFF
jgi:hypothetical protein